MVNSYDEAQNLRYKVAMQEVTPVRWRFTRSVRVAIQYNARYAIEFDGRNNEFMGLPIFVDYAPEPPLLYDATDYVSPAEEIKPDIEITIEAQLPNGRTVYFDSPHNTEPWKTGTVLE